MSPPDPIEPGYTIQLFYLMVQLFVLGVLTASRRLSYRIAYVATGGLVLGYQTNPMHCAWIWLAVLAFGGSQGRA